MISCSIVDVGHGSCAVASDDKASTIVVDCGTRDTLLAFLKHRKIKHIDAVFVSHADADHIGGLPQLFLHPEFRVYHLYVNPDSRDSAAWKQVRRSIRTAREEGKQIIVHPLTTTESRHFGKVGVRVIAPLPEDALSGVGGQGLEGEALSAHRMSAVVLITAKNGEPVILIPGDLDEDGLAAIGVNSNLQAPALVFPHHGGQSGSDLRQFTERLYQLVRPRYVAFSIGRGRHSTPQPEIIETLLRLSSDIEIACTQLSCHCGAKLPQYTPPHLSEDPARGKPDHSCCAGTMTVTRYADGQLTFSPVGVRHAEFAEFKRMYARTALCGR